MKREKTVIPAAAEQLPAASPASPVKGPETPEWKKELEKLQRLPVPPRPVPTARQNAEAEARSRVYLQSAEHCAKVTHPKFGKVIVPHRSNFASILCAAEVWGCDWLEIRNASVTVPYGGGGMGLPGK